METFTDVLLVTANVGSLFDNVSGPNKVINCSISQEAGGLCLKLFGLQKRSRRQGAGGAFPSALARLPTSQPGSKCANKLTLQMQHLHHFHVSCHEHVLRAPPTHPRPRAGTVHQNFAGPNKADQREYVTKSMEAKAQRPAV